MKSLLLLSICLMFPTEAVNGQQGDRKREVRSKKEVIVTDDDKTLNNDKRDSRIDPDDEDKKDVIIDTNVDTAKARVDDDKEKDNKKETITKKTEKSDGPNG